MSELMNKFKELAEDQKKDSNWRRTTSYLTAAKHQMHWLSELLHFVNATASFDGQNVEFSLTSDELRITLDNFVFTPEIWQSVTYNISSNEAPTGFGSLLALTSEYAVIFDISNRGRGIRVSQTVDYRESNCKTVEEAHNSMLDLCSIVQRTSRDKTKNTCRIILQLLTEELRQDAKAGIDMIEAIAPFYLVVCSRVKSITSFGYKHFNTSVSYCNNTPLHGFESYQCSTGDVVCVEEHNGVIAMFKYSTASKQLYDLTNVPKLFNTAPIFESIRTPYPMVLACPEFTKDTTIGSETYTKLEDTAIELFSSAVYKLSSIMPAEDIVPGLKIEEKKHSVFVNDLTQCLFRSLFKEECCCIKEEVSEDTINVLIDVSTTLESSVKVIPYSVSKYLKNYYFRRVRLSEVVNTILETTPSIETKEKVRALHKLTKIIEADERLSLDKFQVIPDSHGNLHFPKHVRIKQNWVDECDALYDKCANYLVRKPVSETAINPYFDISDVHYRFDTLTNMDLVEALHNIFITQSYSSELMGMLIAGGPDEDLYDIFVFYSGTSIEHKQIFAYHTLLYSIAKQYYREYLLSILPNVHSAMSIDMLNKVYRACVEYGVSLRNNIILDTKGEMRPIEDCVSYSGSERLLQLYERFSELDPTNCSVFGYVIHEGIVIPDKLDVRHVTESGLVAAMSSAVYKVIVFFGGNIPKDVLEICKELFTFIDSDVQYKVFRSVFEAEPLATLLR